MSKFLDRFRYFKQKGETFADGHGQLLNTNRDWEDGYRQRWQHDKIVRSTHGVNCTGSCSWKIYVKNGLVMLASVLVFTAVGSFVSSLVPNTTMGSFSMVMTLILRMM